MTSVKLEDVRETPAAPINELVSLLVSQENIPQEGLQELILKNWRNLDEPLDESMMQSLISKCRALSTLELSRV